jgi:hypothetical protein
MAITKKSDAYPLNGWQRMVEELEKKIVVELFAEHYRISTFVRETERLLSQSELDQLEGRVKVLEEIAGFDRAQLRLIDAGSVTPSAS